MRWIKNKKGGTIDNFWVAISFFGFAICMLIALLIWNTLITDPNLDENIWSKSSIGASTQQNAQDFYDGLDFWVVMIYIFLHLGILITAFLLKSHPVIYVAAIFLIITLVYVTVPLQEVWAEMYADDVFEGISSDLYVTNKIMDNFTKLEVIWAFLSVIVLAGFAKSEGFL